MWLSCVSTVGWASSCMYAEMVLLALGVLIDNSGNVLFIQWGGAQLTDQRAYITTDDIHKPRARAITTQ